VFSSPGWYGVCNYIENPMNMESEKKSDVESEPGNSLFLPASTHLSLSERLMRIVIEDDDEEPVDNTQD